MFWRNVFEWNFKNEFHKLKIMKSIHILLSCFLISSCAQLHTVKIGERNNSNTDAHHFETKVNEMGINVQEATQIVKALGNGNKGVNKATKTIDDLWKMISYGPKTGNTVFDDKYADSISKSSLAACSANQTQGVVSVRESMKYPVLSGEIVKIEGICK